MSELAIEWIVGAAIIAYNAMHRFNTPTNEPGLSGIRSCRSTTTLGRYTTFLCFYIATFLGIYWVFALVLQTSPELARQLIKLATIGTKMRIARDSTRADDEAVGETPAATAGDDAVGADAASIALDSPLFVAITLTTLLPTVPWIRRFDTWLLRKFWTLGHIPGHVYRQTDRLLRAHYNLPPSIRQAVASQARAVGLSSGEHDFFAREGAMADWRNACGLMLFIDEWRTRGLPRYARFVADSETEYQALKASFNRLSGRVKALDDWNRSEAQRREETDDSQTDALDMLNEHRRRNEEDEAEVGEFAHELFRRLCGYIVRAVFTVEVGEAGRRRSLARAGFDQNAILVESFTALQILTLFVVVACAFWVLSLVESWLGCAVTSCDKVYVPKLFVVAIMATTYGIGALAGVLPASLLDRRGGLGKTERLVMSYTIAGLLAIVGAFAATVSVRYTNNALLGYTQLDNLERLAVDIGWSYPYLLQPLAIAFSMVALVGQHRRFRRQRSQTSPIRDALVVGGAMCVASTVSYVLINGLGDFIPGSRDAGYSKDVLVLFVAKGTLVGALIGWLAPGWYRRNRNATPFQRLQEFVASNDVELASDAAELGYGELPKALVTAAASVSMADGHLDGIEQDHFLRALSVVHGGGILDHHPDALAGPFAERCHQFKDVHVRQHESALDELRIVRGRRRLSTLTVHLSLAVAYADGWFETEEHDAVQRIISKLRLEEEGFELYPTRHFGKRSANSDGADANNRPPPVTSAAEGAE